MRASSTSIIEEIDLINKEFDVGVYELIQAKQYKAEIIIEKAIAFIPFLLYKLFESEEELNRFCFCINYASRLFPNRRFHIHTDKGEVKTFCWKKNDSFNSDDVSTNYNLESPFVKLLDIFYKINEIKSDNLENFSMNRYLDAKTTNRQDTITLDEQKYNQSDVLNYLKTNYPIGNTNYFRYAAYLWIATGKIQDNPLLQNNPTPETDRLVSEVLSLIADNNKTIPQWHEFKKNDNYIQYNIPIFGLDNGQEKVICNVVIPSLVKLPKELLSAISILSNLWINRIWDYENITWAYANAVRSAIAQVMARNLSHNYGSHVLNHLLRASLGTFLVKEGPYLSHFAQTDPEKKKKEYAELYQQIIYLINQLKDSPEAVEAFGEIKKSKNEENKERSVDYKTWMNDLKSAVKCLAMIDAKEFTNETLRQIVYFLTHLKCRVDYISDISFGAPTIQTTRRVYGDIFSEFDRVSLLLNHISGLEERFTYEIVLRGPDKDDEKKLRILDKDHDIQVAVPNDVVGTQAFYNILENIIRNTAKHSHGTSKSGSVTFHIDFSEMTSTGDWEETIRDEALKYYCVEIYDNIPMNPEAAEELVNAQNKRLNDPIFEGERPRSHSLGLVEMEASAAYLRKLDSSVIDDELYHVINKEQNSELYEKYKDLHYNQYGQFNLLKAIMKPDGKGKYYFGYRFFMLRPQEVLIVVDDNQKDDNQKQEFMRLHNPKEGVWIVTKTEFETALSDNKVFNHEFVVYEGKDVGELIEKHKMALSPRVLQRNIKDWLDKNASPTSPNDIIKECWKQWHEENTRKWKYSDCKTCYNGNDSEAVYLDHMGTDITSFGMADYCEALSSNAQRKLPGFHHNKISGYLHSLRKDQEKKIRNIESVNNRVLIVDERIQDAAEKQKEYGIPLKDHFKKMNVTVPELSDMNLLETDISKVSGRIKEFIEQHCPSHDFVLIHYGILERIFKSEDIKHWKDNLNKYLVETLSKTEPRIILTSGRGVPGGLPPCVGFVSLSSVTAALVDYKSKYLLNCLMYAARKTTK